MDQWSRSQSSSRWAEEQWEQLLLLRPPRRLRPWCSRSQQSCHKCHTMLLGRIYVSHHCVCACVYDLHLYQKSYSQLLFVAWFSIVVFVFCAVSTKSVDMTITNIIEGRVKYTSIPTLHETTDGGASISTGASVSSGRSSSSSLFGGSRSRSAHLSLQRQLSLDERKKLLLEQSRK